MAIIKEFKGMMYDSETVGDMSSVVAPHCHSDEQELISKLYANHPFNVMRLEYPLQEQENQTDKYVKTAETLKQWLSTGIVKVDEQPAIYVYEQEYGAKEKVLVQRGLICKVKIDENVILPHENTNSEMYGEYKSDRYNLMAATKTTFSSIFSLYRDENGEVEEALQTKAEPELEFTDDYGVTHRLWAMKDEDAVFKLKKCFEDKKLIIADGHVRYETAVNFYKKMKAEVVEYNGEEEFNYVMMNLMPVKDSTPLIKPVHRLLKNKTNFSEEELIEKLEKSFSVSKTYIREYDCDKIEARLAENKQQRAIALYTGKDYYYMLVPTEELAALAKTDTELLHGAILGGMLNINKENFKTYVGYAASIEDGERSVREGKANCAFYLNALSANAVFALAEMGERMPKRTNSFFPRLMTGIVMNKFDE